MSFWTVNGYAPVDRIPEVDPLANAFPTVQAARGAWVDAGKPRMAGSIVWATEHSPGGTALRTLTLDL